MPSNNKNEMFNQIGCCCLCNAVRLPKGNWYRLTLPLPQFIFRSKHSFKLESTARSGDAQRRFCSTSVGQRKYLQSIRYETRSAFVVSVIFEILIFQWFRSLPFEQNIHSIGHINPRILHAKFIHVNLLRHKRACSADRIPLVNKAIALTSGPPFNLFPQNCLWSHFAEWKF